MILPAPSLFHSLFLSLPTPPPSPKHMDASPGHLAGGACSSWQAAAAGACCVHKRTRQAHGWRTRQAPACMTARGRPRSGRGSLVLAPLPRPRPLASPWQPLVSISALRGQGA
jgi:hypothetical protein